MLGLDGHKAGYCCCGHHADMTAMAEPLGVLSVLQIDHELSVPAGAPISAQLWKQLCCAVYAMHTYAWRSLPLELHAQR